MASVLHLAIFDVFQLPFAFTVLLILIVIWLYTFRSGIQTVLYTDVFQTAFLLLAVLFSIGTISSGMNLSFSGLSAALTDNTQVKVFEWSLYSKDNFFKLVITGAVLTIVTNGLDQSVMQKHLTCRKLIDSWKNMFSFSAMLLLSNILFLFLGFLLVLYSTSMQIPIPEKTDDLYPLLALNHLGGFTAALFLLGITAAAFSSADSALTALTTSVCIDFLGYKRSGEGNHQYIRHVVHFVISLVLFGVLLAFHSMLNTSMIRAFVSYSGFIYGPLLRLYVFGLFTKFHVIDKAVPFVCVASPIVSVVIKKYSTVLFGGYQLEYEIMVVNGAITFVGLLLFSSCFHSFGQPKERVA